jgi:predicted phage-related endonuclease
LGLSRWRGPFDVWQDKVSDLKPDDETSKPWLARGRYLEPAVASWYADDAGVKLSTGTMQTVTGPEPWMLASVDAIVLADPVYGLECKTSRNADEWGESGTDVVPVEFQIQSAWYMMVMDCQRWDVAVFLTMKEEFRRYTLLRDIEVEAHIVDTCKRWWQRHIVDGVQPEIDGSSGASEWIRRRFPKAFEPLREASTEERSIISELQATKKQLKALGSKEQELRNRLSASIGSSAGIEWGGGRATYKEQSRKSLDQKALKAVHPDIAAQFERTSSFRVLRVKSSDDEDDE